MTMNNNIECQCTAHTHFTSCLIQQQHTTDGCHLKALSLQQELLTRPTVLHCQAPLSIQGCRY